jgi:Tfp pilus assembly protein PilF
MRALPQVSACFIIVSLVFRSVLATKKKARQLLEQATKLAPTGLDAWYFYGDFLYEQKEYSKAAEAFRHALSLPPHPDRPEWDKNRRLVIEERLASIAAKQ